MNVESLALLLGKLNAAVHGLTAIVQKHSEEEKTFKEEARENADDVDDYKQKNLRGKSFTDIASCHYLPKGGIFFSLWNVKPGSAYGELVKNIKKA